MPPERGNWHTTYTRFQRWAVSGVWQRVFEAVQDEAALHTLLVDSTTVRVHQHASGARKKNGPQALGRSCGGLTTKLHAVADARGRPVRFGLSAGQRHDAPQALPLLGGLAPTYLIADRGYDSDSLVAALAARGTQVVIPPRRKRRTPWAYDAARYATPSNGSLAASSSSAAWLRAMTSLTRIFCPLCGWRQPSSGYANVNNS